MLGFFLWLTFGHLLRIVTKAVELGGDRVHSGQGGISVALVGDELSAYFRCAQTGRETVGTERWVGVTLAIDKRFDIGQQVGEMRFHRFATACRKGIETGEPALQLVEPFAKGHTAPSEFPFRPPLSPSP